MSSAAREKILSVAGVLFFRHGYRAVGVDTIIAESGVAKATLYRHFPSKDDLIVAYLEAMNTQFWAWFDQAANAHPDQPRAQLEAVFDALQTLVSTPTCYGCPFLMAAGEFPESDHPGHLVARQNKEAVRARLMALCAAAGLARSAALADHLLLLMDGAFMAVRLFGHNNPAAEVGSIVRTLLDCAEQG